MAMLDHALALARKGFRVFPLKENSKLPAIENWPAKATTAENQLHKWFDKTPYNIGVATGQGVVVLDYDMKEGQQGRASLDAHETLGIPDTFQVETPSGGKHLYFKTNQSIRNSASKIARNVDVRGDGGYVVGPGSTLNGTTYKDAGTPTLEELPAWLVAQAKAKRTKLDASKPIGEQDEPEQIARAKTYLENEAPEAIEGNAGDETTFRVACQVKDLGISRQTCLELLIEHWNPHKAHPPWPGEALEAKVLNAYAYGSLPAGIANAAAEFSVIDPSLLDTELYKTSDTKAQQARLWWVDFNKGADDAFAVLKRPLIEDLLDCGGLSAVYGRPGSGKTFAALDWAFHVATGKPWSGHTTTQGLVIYIAAEGGFAIYKRLRALRQHHGLKEKIPFAVVPCPVNLLEASKAGDTTGLIDLIKQAEEHYGQKATLIVIDTLSRALAGGDENSSVDMGTFVRHVDKIRVATDAHVMIVAHSGKDQAKGVRGWSGLLAALDSELEVHQGQITVTKQRDMEIIEPVRFVLKVVKLGADARGKQVTSCVVDTSQGAVAAEDFERLTPQEQEVLSAIETLEHDKTRQNAPITNGTIRQFLGSIHLSTPPMDKGLLSRKLTKLTNSGHIKRNEHGQWVTTQVDNG